MKILILGSNGLVGSSLYRRLRKNKEYEVIGSTRNDANLFFLPQLKIILKIQILKF